MQQAYASFRQRMCSGEEGSPLLFIIPFDVVQLLLRGVQASRKRYLGGGDCLTPQSSQSER